MSLVGEDPKHEQVPLRHGDKRVPLEKLREIAEYLARFSDNGQHRRIPGPDAGHCHVISKDLVLIAEDLAKPPEVRRMDLDKLWRNHRIAAAPGFLNRDCFDALMRELDIEHQPEPQHDEGKK